VRLYTGIALASQETGIINLTRAPNACIEETPVPQANCQSPRCRLGGTHQVLVTLP
jgi:hypothetical protein